jgi:hypothetical protein
MTKPAFILCDGNLTYDQAEPNLCTDEPVICYGLPVPTPTRGTASGGGGGVSTLRDWLPQTGWFDGGGSQPEPELEPRETVQTAISGPEIGEEVSKAALALGAVERAVQEAPRELLEREVVALKGRLAELQSQPVALAPEVVEALIRLQVRVAKLETLVAILSKAGLAGEAQPEPGRMHPLVAAGLVALGTYALVPDSMRGLREAGYSVAAGIAIREVLRSLRP